MTPRLPSAATARHWLRWAGPAALTLIVAFALFWWRRDGDADSAQGPGADGVSGRSSWATAPDEAGKRPIGRVPVFLTAENVASPHSQALRAKDEARARGASVPRTSALFEAEARDPTWAPAMERALAERLARGQELFANAGLNGVEVKHECRTSTCRLQLEYTQGAPDKSRAFGTKHTNPYALLAAQTGPFARSASDESPEPIAVVDGMTRYRKVVHMAFGEEDSKPSQYERWHTEVNKRWAESRARRGPAIQHRGQLPPPEER